MMSILDDYKITFGATKGKNSDHSFMKSKSSVLDGFVIDFRTVLECDNLLEVINFKLDNPYSEEVIYNTQGLQLIKITHYTTEIYRDSAKFDSNPDSIADETLPTADFREIVEAWKNFISTGNP